MNEASDLTKEEQKNIKIAEKNKKKQERILKGSIIPTIFAIGIPLAFYNFTNYLYGIFDLIIISRFGIGSVDGVAILDQIRNMISALGGAVIVAGSILVARKVGAGDMKTARKRANNLFIYVLFIGIITLAITIPFASPLLRLLGTPENIIMEYQQFFVIQMISAVIVLLNGAFIGLEKSRGNTKRLIYLNFVVMIVKVTLNIVFVSFIPDVSATHLALATLFAQLSLFIIALFVLFNPSNQLGISLKYLKFDPRILKKIVAIALPIFIGRFLFSFGKVFVNAQAVSVYGGMAVGALALSNSIAGGIHTLIMSFEETSSTMINQNYGNKNIKRTIQIFYRVNILAITVATLGLIMLTIFREPLVNFLIPLDPYNLDDTLYKREMLMTINRLESFAFPIIALDAASTSFLLGYSKSSLVMITASARIFLFRIPPLLIMMHMLNVSWYATGIAMLISNVSAGILGFALAAVLIRRIKKENGYKGLRLQK